MASHRIGPVQAASPRSFSKREVFALIATGTGSRAGSGFSQGADRRRSWLDLRLLRIHLSFQFWTYQLLDIVPYLSRKISGSQSINSGGNTSSVNVGTDAQEDDGSFSTHQVPSHWPPKLSPSVSLDQRPPPSQTDCLSIDEYLHRFDGSRPKVIDPLHCTESCDAPYLAQEPWVWPEVFGKLPGPTDFMGAVRF